MTIKITADDHRSNIRFFLDAFVARQEPRGVIHIGAHQGEEVSAYFEYGFERVILIEANPQWSALLDERFGGDQRVRVFNIAVTDHDGTVRFNVHRSRSGNTEPSSILELKEFKRIVKTLETVSSFEVPAVRLDSLLEQQKIDVSLYNLINIDVQGAELLAFRGASQTLRSVDAVISEVNLIEMYEGGAREPQIVELLAEHQLKKVDALYHELYDEKGRFPAWGEALFMRGAV